MNLLGIGICRIYSIDHYRYSYIYSRAYLLLHITNGFAFVVKINKKHVSLTQKFHPRRSLRKNALFTDISKLRKYPTYEIKDKIENYG